MILADKIIEERKSNGWSQEELAEKLGVPRQSASKWEGARPVPDFHRILQMIEIFGMVTFNRSMEYFVGCVAGCRSVFLQRFL